MSGEWRTKSFGLRRTMPASGMLTSKLPSGLIFSFPSAWQLAHAPGTVTLRLLPHDASPSREALWVSSAAIPPSSGVSSARDEGFRPFAGAEVAKVDASLELWSVADLPERDGALLTYKPPMETASPAGFVPTAVCMCAVVAGHGVAVCAAGDPALIAAREATMAQILLSIRAPTPAEASAAIPLQALVGTWTRTGSPWRDVLELAQDGRLQLQEAASARRRVASWRASSAPGALELLFDDDQSSPRMLQWALRADGVLITDGNAQWVRM